MFAPACTSGLIRAAIPLGVANFKYALRVPRGGVATASTAPTLPLAALVLIFQGRISAELT